jgi:hypothetical protein
MGTVVDVIINQKATHRRFTCVTRGRNLYKLIKDIKKKPYATVSGSIQQEGGWGSEVGGGGCRCGGQTTVKVWDNFFLCS